MNVEFRSRSTSEILQILNRCKWLIGLPAITVFLAVAWVVRELPDVYQSTTLLTIAPPKISEKVAPSLTDADLSQRLQSISQLVLSRSSLEPMIDKYDLFSSEKAAGMPIDLIVEKMKKNIEVLPERANDDRVVGFRINVRGSSPLVVQQLTSDIAAKYVTAQTEGSKQSAETTREFIDAQMSQARANLDALEKQRISIMTQNIETLPESGQGLIAQLEGLRQREQTISKDKESLVVERVRAQESIRAINSQMSLIETFGEKDQQDEQSRIEDTSAYGQLIQKRAELNAKLENLKKQYREKHPDIVQTQTEINKINDELEKLVKNTDQRRKEVNRSISRKSELQKRSLEIEREKLESQLEQIARQMQSKEDDVRQNSVQIAVLEAKINTIPSVKVALEGVDNQYSSAKTTYDELLKKYTNAQQQVDRETNEQGETIGIVDPANLPQSPANASKRPLFMGVGFGAGLALGLFLAAFFEAPRLMRLQNIKDAEHYTGFKVLASIPPLLNDSEIAWKKRLNLIQVFGGIIVACSAVPGLIILLQVSRLFERFS